MFKRFALAESSKSTYRSQLNCFLRFCIYYNRQDVPANQETLKCYVAFLARSLNPNSIAGYLNVIRILHVNAGLPNPLHENFEIKMIRKGILRRLGRPPKQKLPITLVILRNLHSQLNLSSAGDRAFWAACLVGFFGLLRKSTLLPNSINDKSPDYMVRQDITGLSLHFFLLNVRHSKTIQFGQRLLRLPFVACDDPILCPVSAIIHHLGSSVLPQSAPLFSYIFKGKILSWTHSQLVSKLKNYLASLGYNSSDFSGHSFRRGGCTFCFEAGLDLISIKLCGDWKTNAFERYIHVPHSAILNSAVVLSNFAAKY